MLLQVLDYVVGYENRVNRVRSEGLSIEPVSDITGNKSVVLRPAIRSVTSMFSTPETFTGQYHIQV
jgi:hypothetical protein